MHVMAKMCANCPFDNEAAVNRSFGPRRFDEIKRAVLAGHSFHCHKSVFNSVMDLVESEDEEDSWEMTRTGLHWKECRGALDYRTEMLRRDPEAADRAIMELFDQIKDTKRRELIDDWLEARALTPGRMILAFVLVLSVPSLIFGILIGLLLR